METTTTTPIAPLSPSAQRRQERRLRMAYKANVVLTPCIGDFEDDDNLPDFYDYH